jgi:hypothetical protein
MKVLIPDVKFPELAEVIPDNQIRIIPAKNVKI